MLSLLSLAKIATYLNLVATKAGTTDELEWLTGRKTDKITVTAAVQHEETQCMSFGSTLWIANNADADTKTQQSFVNKIGVAKPHLLLQHVEKYGSRLLPTWQGAISVNAFTPKAHLLYLLLGSPAKIAKAYTLPGAAACGSYALDPNTTPSIGGIVFVRGTYDGTVGSTHAEQKLLAALGVYLQRADPKSIPGELHCGGTKAACTECKTALTAVQSKLKATKVLKFDDGAVKDHRTTSGLNDAHPSNISGLTVATYFP